MTGIEFMKKCLKIYKASAGSGKTFTLAIEYIKLLVENPYCYRNILAVTFTNKATGEMKGRILSKLYGVANRAESANDYLVKIKEQLPGKSEEEIVRNAKLALELILHDYGHFRIQTIDAFFQSVLRGLAKELDLSGDMEISIDGKELLSDAVDTFIRNLEPDRSDTGQVVRYIEEQLDNGGSWHVEENIKKFAENILMEEYLERGDKLREEIDRENGIKLEKFRTEITERKQEIENNAKALAEEFFALAGALTADDFNGRSRSGAWPFFTKMRNGDMPELTAGVEKLIDEPGKISKVCSNCAGIAALIERYKAMRNGYNSCRLSMSHFHQLGLLNSIAKTLKDENARENRFLLADTTHLLSSMIKSNTSFIFEKIGTEIDHIFIDEFQDTSKLQWVCFEVLLKEVLSRGNFNLIVGDVKQAIYRWRNGDWKIMNDLESYFKEFNGILEFESQGTTIEGKEYQSVNYRSDRRIISFNNAFYSSALECIKESFSEELGSAKLNEIMSAYSDVEQAYPSRKENSLQGFVQVRRVMREKNQKDNEFYGIVIKKMMETLHMLIDEKGVAPKDIAILLRSGGQTANIVEEFKKEFPALKIVSDDAYKLSSSLTVSLAVAAMRYIAMPEDKVNIANMLNLYNKVILKNNNPLEEYVSQGELVELLPEKFRADLDHLRGLPAYELIEQLMTMLNIEESKGEESYIYAFLDHMSQYINSKDSDLMSLINAWDEGLCDKCIPVENDDSIKIMTIHKSKGLEFHTVIIPFCSWKLTADTRSLLWCEPKEEPFNALSLVPVKSVSSMKESIYNEEYHKEFMYQIVDNLNILYVGTTRAKSNLVIFSETKEKSDTPYVWKLVNGAIDNMRGLEGSAATGRDDEEIFTYGDVVPSRKENSASTEEEICDNPFESEPIPLLQPLTSHENRIEVKQSRELARFLASDEEKKALKNIAEGELMHMVMSEIETAQDIGKALDRLLLQGVIDDAARLERIRSLVVRALSNPDANAWFDGTYRLYNECTILSRKDDKFRRPDRVMIKGNEAVVVDYKFGRMNDEHDKQVHQYMTLLKEMKYENVKGYLWYVYKNEIKEVTL